LRGPRDPLLIVWGQRGDRFCPHDSVFRREPAAVVRRSVHTGEAVHSTHRDLPEESRWQVLCEYRGLRRRESRRLGCHGVAHHRIGRAERQVGSGLSEGRAGTSGDSASAVG